MLLEAGRNTVPFDPKDALQFERDVFLTIYNAYILLLTIALSAASCEKT